ncbi:type VI secretion system accessory protein TagJ [Tropicimonas sp. TH_r6]|uniref:type VI secretion system accessory protein TagJ n=1 Tax=Tropicimonas sp. TH_r6 TaxID=3082085 RepID=UPI0029552DB4|nr:type VI secretion system accessory protein TagJ [Tropicimonas sp. TH_r6]MDV7143088.1 type VI secretion system accessory protein TagJ [Tropicimonas sp. TH_r6]
MSSRAHELLLANDLSGALDALQDAVRANPADSKLRIFLFQLLCVTGDWKRAINQLKLSATMDEAALEMAKAYREVIRCEVFREAVFTGEREPLVFGEPQEWVALLMEALKLLAGGKAAEAADLRARAFEAAPAMGGEINDTRFEWVADADMRLGPVLEAVVNGRYFWMPFAAISEIHVDEPTDLRDAVWTGARITLQNGGEVTAFIPTRYPGTCESGDGAAMLAKRTDWIDAGAETFTGIGQRLLATEAEDVALMDLRSLKMDEATPPSET